MSCYLDHAATSPLREQARQVLVAELELLGNPSSTHRAGQRARRRLEEAREELAEALGASPSEVVFTSGGSEADAIALIGSQAARPQRHRVLVSAVEHPAVRGMQARGAQLLPVDSSGIVTDEGWRLVDENTAVVSVMAVNNETGVILPLERLVTTAAAHGAWSHSDAVQALGHIPIQFHASALDLMSISAHKIGGPVGIGALLVKRGIVPAAIGPGGGQEADLRSGTVPVALAASFATAARQAVAELTTESARLSALRDQVCALVLGSGGRINGGNCAPHIINATFPGLRAADLLFLLDAQGIYASAGSACRAGVQQPSEVLQAMGVELADASASVRFSLGHSTTADDIDYLAQRLPAAVEQARTAR